MNEYARMLRSLHTPEAAARLNALYGHRDGVMVDQLSRYTGLVKKHEDLFHAEAPLTVVSAPGRAEIAGNHTDHNNGCVLAASITLDTVAVVSPRADHCLNLFSEGYAPVSISLHDLEPIASERGTSAAIVRGVAARLQALGHDICGFDAAVTSSVLGGSGLSSSAAYEVMICAIFDALCGNFALDPIERAQIAQYAENEYFGKPCGLLDQMACSVGGLVGIDFKAEPKVRAFKYDFSARGYTLCVVSTGGCHDDLTDEYAAIRNEMRQVAACFGENVLRRVHREQLLADIPMLRKKVSDRAILRAMHYFNENERVHRETRALERDDLPAFFRDVIASGESSWMLLQNTYAQKDAQPLALALTLAREMLDGEGAWRVHGGGFAGTTLNFVPTARLTEFVSMMERAFDVGCCHVLDIRPEGAAVVLASE